VNRFNVLSTVIGLALYVNKPVNSMSTQ